MGESDSATWEGLGCSLFMFAMIGLYRGLPLFCRSGVQWCMLHPLSGFNVNADSISSFHAGAWSPTCPWLLCNLDTADKDCSLFPGSFQDPSHKTGFPMHSLTVFPSKPISSLTKLLCLKSRHKAKVCACMDRKFCVLKASENKIMLPQSCVSRQKLCSSFTYLSRFLFVFPNISDWNRFTLTTDWSWNSCFVMWFWIIMSVSSFPKVIFLGFLKDLTFGLLAGCAYLVQLFVMLFAVAE